MSKPRSTDSPGIPIIGADANNLKNVDVTFPLKRISVVTGVSGSGKSSLLLDTLGAEGSRRTRIFLDISQQDIEQDDVRAFIGPLPPTILVGQRGFRPSVRTTVGTATGFLSVLRRLFVLASVPYSDRAKETVPPPSPGSYADWISNHYRGPLEIWAAPIRQQRTDCVSAVKRLESHGIRQFVMRSETDPPRLRDSGRIVETSQFKGSNGNVAHTVEALVGGMKINGVSQAKQLRELLDQAFSAGHGSVVVTLPAAVDPDLMGPFGPRLDSAKHWVHPATPEVFFRPSAHLLSFNAPEHEESGACRVCHGTGIARRLIESALVSNPQRSMRSGAFAIWTEKNYKYVNVQHETIEGLNGMEGFSPEVPWSKLPASARELVLNGSRGELVFDRERTGRKFGDARPFIGFRKIILDKSAAGTKTADHLAPYVETGPCDSCGGTRWSFQARALRVGGHGIAEILGMTFTELEAFAAVRSDFAGAVPSETRFLVEAIRRHAHSIALVGVGYLTGDRGMVDVSEGESRRIRLARVLDAGEKGLCLLLDEPARGLHEADLSNLALSLERLRGKHTVILNEHRERLWEIADRFIEVGPRAGTQGGEITYAGSHRRPERPDDGPLRTQLAILPDQPRVAIRGACINNVEKLDCEIPLGRLTCVSGVSGSGKSSFVRGVLAPALCKAVGGTVSDFALRKGRWRSLSGARSITEVVALDQVMPPANRRSLVATATDVFDDIRKVFGTSPAAMRDGLSASDFGINAGEGRCPVCMGVGEVADGDLWSVCPACGGACYRRTALAVRVGGVNVQELLRTPVERLGPLADTFKIPRSLIAAMCDLGIGYVALGRRIDTLSGGEVQRLRLAMRLSTESAGSMFFILDEPAVGLHPNDVRRLAIALDRVLDQGRHTIVIIEHDLRLIRSADWVLDFGPGAGPEGGKIIYAGLPQQLARTRTPTGMALAGSLPARNSIPQPAPPEGTKVKLSLDQQISRTRALIRTLISGDATATVATEEGLAEPIVPISEDLYAGRDPWEVAGLDLEIPKLLLDVQRTAESDAFANLLASWKGNADCWLAIHPFLTEMQIWGRQVPRSVIQSVSAHVSKEGLHLITDSGRQIGEDFDVRNIRATGGRLTPDNDSDEARLRVLRDAFAIGAGYVELRDRRGQLQATASNRLLDLKTALIAPMTCVPAHFSRLDPIGRCPLCKGTRGIAAVSEALIVKDRSATPDSERFLTTEANAIMRGVRHNELSPFLRRLAKEGLWDLKVSFERLDREKRDLILFGFWSRPGAGSFLKSPRSNPAEVSSWLRWDGLHRHIIEQSGRSRNADWGRKVHESVQVKCCILCGGSGLQPFASLLRMGQTSFTEWIQLTDSARRLDLLDTVKTHTARQRSTLKRVVHCLAPLARPTAHIVPVIEVAIKSFTTMPSAKSDDLNEI